MTAPRDEELLAVILDPLRDMAVIGLDSQGRVVQWTAGAEREVGFTPTDILSEHISALYTEEDVEEGRPERDLAAAASRGHVVSDGWQRKSDGTRFWARTVLRSRYDADGRLTGFVKLICDLSDHLEVQRSMAASDQRFAGLVEHSVDGIISTDEHGRIILFNRGAEVMFGYDRSEVIGESLAMLLPEALRALHAGYTEEFRSGERTSTPMAAGRSVHVRTKDGREFPVEATISKLDLDRGAILSVILRDSSEREAVEAALVSRELVASELSHSLPMPIVLFDHEWVIHFANEAFAKWAGRSPEELRGSTLRGLAEATRFEASLDAATPDIHRALSGVGCRFEGRVRRSDGTVREIQTTLVPVRDATGTVTGVYAVVVDRTDGERPRVAREVHRALTDLLAGSFDAHQMIRAVARLARAVISDDCQAFVVGGDGRTEAVDPESPTALDPVPAIVRSSATRLMPQWATNEADGSTLLAVPIPCTERPGGALLFVWEKPFEGESDTEVIAVSFGAELAAALDRIALARRATDAIRGRDWLLQRVAHDLGNPVAAITMAIERVLRSTGELDRPDRTRVLLEGISRQANEMRLTVEELLDAVALRTGRAHVVLRPVDAARIVRDAASLVQPIAAAQDVEILVEPGTAGFCMADARHLRHALTALLSEAIDHSPGRRVTIRAAVLGNEIRFEISRPGAAESEGSLRSLADRGDATMRLPLLIADELVRAHGTTLDRAISREADEEETCYRFSLPKAP